MRTATSLTLLTIGAILTFAVRAHPSFLNLQVAGLVIMAVGLAGLLLNREGWLRRRIVLRRGAGGPVISHIDEANFPSYVTIDPEALQAVQPISADAEPASLTIPDVMDGEQAAGQMSSGGRAPADALVVEEYVEE